MISKLLAAKLIGIGPFAIGILATLHFGYVIRCTELLDGWGVFMPMYYCWFEYVPEPPCGSWWSWLDPNCWGR